MTSDPRAETRRTGASWLIVRAIGPMLCAGGLLAATAGVVWRDDARPFAQSGALAALLAGILALVVLARALVRENDARGGFRLQLALASAFALHFFGVGVAVLALHFSAVKFAGLAAFGLAFAGSALVLQTLLAWRLGRLLKLRTTTHSGAGRRMGPAPVGPSGAS